jgi:selenium metabolism protein YedF
LNNQLDCRGLACPLPVIETKKALAGLTGEALTVLVDNQVAKENVVKFATAQQCGVSVEGQDGDFRIRITKSGIPAAVITPVGTAASSVGGVWLITQDSLGHGNKELGSVLMKSFFYTLTERELPSKVLFINSGVLLTLQDSPVLAYIETLAGRGVEVLSCGTCLDYYGVKERLAVGGITNMYTIVEALATGRAVTL